MNGTAAAAAIVGSFLAVNPLQHQLGQHVCSSSSLPRVLFSWFWFRFGTSGRLVSGENNVAGREF